MDLRLITAPFRFLATVVGLIIASIYFIITLAIVEVAGVYIYLQYLRPEALDRLLDGNSTIADFTEILLSIDVILVMILLIPVNSIISYIAQTTESRPGEGGS